MSRLVSLVTLFLFFLPFNLQAQVTLAVGGGAGLPGSSSNPVEINCTNPDYKIKAIEIEVCDQGDYLSVSVPVGCETTQRTEHFICTASELGSGCARVVLFSFQGALIEEGDGPLCTLSYEVDQTAARNECSALTISNESVSGESGVPLTVQTGEGTFCFCLFGDLYPPGDPLDSSSCGDGVVNLLDVLEAGGLLSGSGPPNTCQQLNGDIPNGSPPYCGNPAESSNCEADNDFDLFDLVVIIDIVLGRTNCGDYCGR